MQRTSGSEAFGRPGIELKWTHGGTDAVGTAYAASSHIWFTFWNGILTEAYYPTVDRPQIRDLQYLVTDGKSFFHEERRHLQSKVELLSAHALGIAVPTPIQLRVMPSSKQSSPIHTMHAFVSTPKSSVTSPLSRVHACMLCVLLISRVSCGYVGRSDGWTDLADNFQMDWEFDQASDENIALTGELNLTDCREVTLGLAFGVPNTKPLRHFFKLCR